MPVDNLISSRSSLGDLTLRFCCILLLTLCAPQSIAEEQAEGAQKPWRMANFSTRYQQLCAVCHGNNLEGSPQGPALVGNSLNQGDSLEAIALSIATGQPDKGMPSWTKTLTEEQINNLALYILEQREGLSYLDFKVNQPLRIPAQPLESQHHRFRLKTVISGIDPLPVSIAPLPDGRILLLEKLRGLSIVSVDGQQSPLITGTPKVHKEKSAPDVGLFYGLGWMLDIAIAPGYPEPDWIYLQYGDRCSDCNAISRESGQPVSLNKLVRGRIRNGHWVDEQTLWQGDKQFYGLLPDSAAGGRIAFDGKGHLFFSIGVKGNDNFRGVQDLKTPWGKIHRITTDGKLPLDNPFTQRPGTLGSIWSFGHRNPQGLEYNFRTEELWSTEMGPRGGDEVNRIVAGKNYGWPLVSKGANYDGTVVDYGTALGLEWDIEDIEQPLVDLTPAPAVSSFIFYQGNTFPQWQGDMIIGSLKAASLYRMRFEGDTLIEREFLIRDLARIRDIEVAHNGDIYLLLEHDSGGQIIRMTAIDESID